VRIIVVFDPKEHLLAVRFRIRIDAIAPTLQRKIPNGLTKYGIGKTIRDA
jgi:hypothetical protein